MEYNISSYKYPVNEIDPAFHIAKLLLFIRIYLYPYIYIYIYSSSVTVDIPHSGHGGCVKLGYICTRRGSTSRIQSVMKV